MPGANSCALVGQGRLGSAGSDRFAPGDFFTMTSRVLRTAFPALAITTMTACSPDRYTEIQALCREQARTIVIEPVLFSEWLAQARAQAAERAREFKERPRVTGYEAVPGFELRHGPDLGKWRERATEEIRREDVFLVKNGIRVAQFINFTVLIRRAAQSTSMSCYGSYFSNLYFQQ